MKFLFLIQARTGSTRLPEKVMMNLWKKYSLIEYLYAHLRLSKHITKDNLFVLTTENKKDDALASMLLANNIPFFRGDENNVYERFFSFLKQCPQKADYVVRICGDNPFIDTGFIDELIKHIEGSATKAGYVSYITPDGTPAIQTKYGFFCEFIDYNTFVSAHDKIVTDFNREHVTPFFYTENKERCSYLTIPEKILATDYKFSVDTQDDLERVRKIASVLSTLTFNYTDVLNAADKFKMNVK